MFEKFPWEIMLAFVINFILLLVFLSCSITSPSQPSQPLEITLDLSDFTPPAPQNMQVPDVSPEDMEAHSTVDMGNPTNVEAIASEVMQEFSPVSISSATTQPQISEEYHQELERIEQRIRTFDGINQVNSGLKTEVLPAGHQIGASFQERGNAQTRGRLLKRHGGNKETEIAVEMALKYLASVQNANGSWGSKESFKTGDAAALSALALLTFFSHGETFHSAKYGENIRKGCDFLIELSKTPNIEYAGKSFGHAILTYALAEGFAMTGSLSLKTALENRLKSILAHQNAFGSFAVNYDNSPLPPPTQEQLNADPLLQEIVVGEPACDLSLLGWHIQALTAAKNAGVNLENVDNALTMALEALVKIHQAEKGGFSQGINMKRFPANEQMTTVGLLGMYLLAAGNSSPARRAERLLRQTPPPQWGHGGVFPLYRWYYQTQALFHAEKGRGKRWDEWNNNLKNELLNAQNADGSWSLPTGDNSFRIQDHTDLSIYSSALCALMLQVYYRYLPSYNIAESSRFEQSADNLDLGATGLISRLPGGVDPMASVILGIDTGDLRPIHFGVFNGLPQSPESPLVDDEFFRYASLRSTIPVRSPADWPQTVQANQRLALFFDELLSPNFKGSLRLLLGIIGSDTAAQEYQQSLEVVLNGKRLFNSFLLRNKQLVEIVIPGDLMQPYGNILQIRNNGKAVLAFDAAVLDSAHQVGGPLFLLAGDPAEVPGDLRAIFSRQSPEHPEICELSWSAENRQLLPEISAFDPQKIYLGRYRAVGHEAMGNEFQLHYLRQTGREIIDWLSGGGSGVIIDSISTGGKLYDSIFQVEYPAASALKQTAKLFEGSPRKLSSQIYPRYGEKPGLFLASAASYNAPGIATVVVARRFPFPEESEVIALIPWTGETEILIERGLLPENSPFLGFASKIETEKKKIFIKDNIFRYSTIFPELTVIRLIRTNAQVLPIPSQRSPQIPSAPSFEYHGVINQFPRDAGEMKKHPIRRVGGYTAVWGGNVSCSRIPATVSKKVPGLSTPVEQESVGIAFRVHRTHPKRFDSAYLTLGAAPRGSRFLAFNVFTRMVGQEKRERMPWVTFRFALCGKLYSTTVRTERWERIIIPLNGMNPAWQSLRILEPDGLFSERLQSISFEINDVAVYGL